MPLLSKEEQLEAVCSELQEASLRRQQLNDRLGLLSMLKDFRQNAGFREDGEYRSREAVDTNENNEYGMIEEELKKLSERKRELQAKKDALEHSGIHFKGDALSTVDGPAPPSGFGSQIFFVDKPPDIPAPQIITDVKKLPPRPSPTQCPHCQQYITTEISMVTGNTAWLVCLVCTFLCCIAGCCLIPFCTDSFKDIVHKCPKCRSQLHACRKL